MGSFGYFSVLVLISVATWLLVRAVRYSALWWRLIDVPNHRSQHRRPTPTGGGLAIVLTCALGIPWAATAAPAASRFALACYGVGAALIAGVSALDDLRHLPCRVRLLFHIFGAAVLLAGCTAFGASWPDWLAGGAIGWLAVVVAAFWIVGLTNAYNFMDGLDGMAGTQGVIAGLGWMLLGWISGQTWVGAVGGVLAAASFGFLVENWPPARIFMGDVGSAFLGFTFAALPVIAAQSDPSLFLPGVLVVWPCVFDAGATFLRRLARRENVFTPHRLHFYQQLSDAGYPAAPISAVYGGLSIAGVLMAIAHVLGPAAIDGWIAGFVSLLAAGLVVGQVTACRRRRKPGCEKSLSAAFTTPGRAGQGGQAA